MDLDPFGGKDRVERGGELRVAVADQEPVSASPLAEVHEQVSGLLCNPLLYGMRRHPQQVHPAGGQLDDEQHVQPPQQHGVHGEEVHRQHTVGLGMQELPLNHALYLMAIVQVRHPTAGRAYYRRKRAEARRPRKRCGA